MYIKCIRCVLNAKIIYTYWNVWACRSTRVHVCTSYIFTSDGVAPDPSASGTVVAEVKTEPAKVSGRKAAVKVKEEPKEEEQSGPKSGGKKGKSGREERGEKERSEE